MMVHKGDELVPGHRLDRRLGKGSFGEVWLAAAPGGTKVALKFVDLSSRPGVKELRGLQRMQQIRHAHLVPIYALWGLDDEGRPVGKLDTELLENNGTRETVTLEAFQRECPRYLCVAMSLADKTLLERLEECRREGHPGIPVKELLDYMEQAARGIDFLNAPRHDLGSGPVAVQHCDIKPANLLLVGDSVMICDYGLAWILSENQATATTVGGTMAYMAPECLDRRPGPGTDQYSLAVTYFELRTGSLPFDKSMSLVSMMDAHRSGALDFSRLPPAEREVIRRATAVKPEDRYPSVGEMVRALRRAVEQEQQHPPDWKKRWAMAAAAATVLAAASVALAWRPWETPTITPPPKANGASTAANGAGSTPQTAAAPEQPPAGPSAAELATQATSALHNESLARAVEWMSQAIRADPKYAEPSPDHTLTGFGGGEQPRIIDRIAISPDGRWLAAVGEHAAAWLWDTRALERPPTPLPGATHSMSDAAFSHDSRFLLTGDLPNATPRTSYAARLWRLDKLADGARELTQPTDGVGAVAFSPDDRWAAVGGQDGAIRLWDSKAQQERPVLLTGHEFPVKQLVFVASRDLLLSLSGDAEPVLQWKLAADRDALAAAQPQPLLRTGVKVIAVAERGWLAAGGVEGKLTFVDLSGKAEPIAPTDRLHGDDIEAVAVHPDGSHFATGDATGAVALWELTPAGEPDGERLARHEHAVVAIAFSHDGRWLATGSWDATVRLYLLDGEAPNQPLTLRHPQRIMALAFSPDNRWLWTASDEGIVRGWDLRRCEMIQRAAAQAAHDGANLRL